jgi:hypothetical protein
MMNRRSGRGKTSEAISIKVEFSLLEITLKFNPKASELCSTEFASSALIRLYFEQGLCALRVCGKKCCFSSHFGQAEMGKLVLLLLAVQESDNFSHYRGLPQIWCFKGSLG